MKNTWLFIFVPLYLVVFMNCAFAVSVTPKDVSIDVTDLAGGPTTDYRFMQLHLMGKDNDDTSLGEEYGSQRYLTVQTGLWWAGNYNGPSNYLVLSFDANGLGGIGTYPAGEIAFTIDGSPFEIALPRITMTDQATRFSLYIAEDGSTYYGRSDHAGTTGGGMGKDLYDRSLDLAPSEAFVPEHLAAAIPEPSTLSLLGLALVLGVKRLRRPQKPL